MMVGGGRKRGGGRELLQGWGRNRDGGEGAGLLLDRFWSSEGQDLLEACLVGVG